MLSYVVLKTIHVTCVALSGTFFFVRGLWKVRGKDLLKGRWARISPHLIDTVLLGSAIGLALTIRQYPGTHAWLTAKLIGLLIYIVLGAVVLRARSAKVRTTAWVGATLVFLYIVSVAVTHNPMPLAAVM